MVELLEGLDLPEVHHLGPAVVLSLHRLYRHLLPRLLVEGQIDQAVRSIPDQVDHFVALEAAEDQGRGRRFLGGRRVGRLRGGRQTGGTHAGIAARGHSAARHSGGFAGRLKSAFSRDE